MSNYTDKEIKLLDINPEEIEKKLNIRLIGDLPKEST